MKHLILFVLLSAGATGQTIPLSINGKAIVGRGDSRLYGNNASSQSLGWFNLIASEGGASAVNVGGPGQYLQNANGVPYYDHQYTPSKTANANTKYLFFSYGTNDVKGDPAYFTVAGFKSTLITEVDYLVSNLGYSYSGIVLSSINYFSNFQTNGATAGRARLLAYNQAIRDVAQLRNTIYLDPFTYFDALPNKDTQLIDTDGIHETTAGHRVLANFYEAQDYTPINNQAVTPIVVRGRTFRLN